MVVGWSPGAHSRIDILMAGPPASLWEARRVYRRLAGIAGDGGMKVTDRL